MARFELLSTMAENLVPMLCLSIIVLILQFCVSKRPKIWQLFSSQTRIQFGLETKVEFADAQRTAVHRAKHLDVTDGVELELVRYPVLHQVNQRIGDRLWLCPIDVSSTSPARTKRHSAP